MSVLVLLFLGTLAVIYLSSYFEMHYDNMQMLQRHAQTYTLRINGIAQFPQMPDPGDNPYDDRPSFRLSTFYSVAVSDEGWILATDTGNHQLYDEQQLQDYARTILDTGKEQGTKNNLLYFVEQKQGYKLVVFMDNTIVQERITALVRNTLIFGGVTMVLLFFLAMFLAKRIVDPLEDSYQRQKQFISDAGHELKTPVSVISTNAEMLRREIGENQWLSNVQYENERMGLLVHQLLELARTESVSIQMEPLDFSRLAAGEALPFESVAFEKSLSLTTDFEPGLTVTGNSTQLKQLLSILIDNGIEHCDHGGEVAVKLRSDHSTVKLTVVNDGPAISQQQREHLFERFYRADEARQDDGHFGLGLAIASAIVSCHKGKISVQCAEGKVAFLVTLPLHKA